MPQKTLYQTFGTSSVVLARYADIPWLSCVLFFIPEPFLRNHLDVSWAIDFFTVTTVKFVILYVFRDCSIITELCLCGFAFFIGFLALICSTAMKRARGLTLSINMYIPLHVNSDALADMFASTYSVNTLLHLAMTAIGALDRIGSRRQQRIIKER